MRFKESWLLWPVGEGLACHIGSSCQGVDEQAGAVVWMDMRFICRVVLPNARAWFNRKPVRALRQQPACSTVVFFLRACLGHLHGSETTSNHLANEQAARTLLPSTPDATNPTCTMASPHLIRAAARLPILGALAPQGFAIGGARAFATGTIRLDENNCLAWHRQNSC